MAHEKIIKMVKAEGYCCMWAYLEANRSKLTSQIAKEVPCSRRAVAYQRSDYRAKVLVCEALPTCLKERVKAGHTIHPASDKSL